MMKEPERAVSYGALLMCVIMFGIVIGLNHSIKQLQKDLQAHELENIETFGVVGLDYNRSRNEDKNLKAMIEDFQDPFPLWDSGWLEEMNVKVQTNEATLGWHLDILNQTNESLMRFNSRIFELELILCGRIGSTDEGLVYEITGVNCDGETPPMDVTHCLEGAKKFGDTPARYDFYNECVRELEQ